MSHTLTEATTFPSTVTVPDAGDARTAASVNVAFQALADRTRNLYNLTSGLADSLDWSGKLSNDPSAAANVIVRGVRSFVRAGVSYGDSPHTIATSGLASNTWYYVYCYIGAGIQYEYNTTTPDAALVYKSTDSSRRYLGCFRTDGSAVIRPFQASRGRYVYQRPPQPLAGVSYGSAAYRATSLAAYMPPHARVAGFRATLYSLASGASGSLLLRPTGDSDATADLNVGQVTSANGTETSAGDVITDASQSIDHKLTNINHAADLFVTGFRE